MDNIFDTIQNSAFNIVSQTMGYDAQWIPAEGELLTARVLYKDATEKDGLAGIDYEEEKFVMEYRRGDFPGLKDRVDHGGTENLTITIKSVALPFYVRRIETKYDGKSEIAYLQPI